MKALSPPPAVRLLEESLGKRKRELLILSAVASRIHNQEDVGLILEAALQEILSGLSLDAAWVLLGDAPGGKLRLAAQQGVSPQYLRRSRAKGSRTACAQRCSRLSIACRCATRPSVRACPPSWKA